MKNNAKKIESMRLGGHILAQILSELSKLVEPGISTQDIEDKTVDLLKKHNVKSAFLGFNGYPKNICVSINDEVVHGIPSIARIIEKGDLVKLDMGIIHKGYNTDSAVSIPVGKITNKEIKLVEATKKAFSRVAQQIKAGDRVGKIGRIIEETAKEFDLTVVDDLTGHGIGRKLHEHPVVYNFGQDKQGPALKEGDTLAIEPMFSMGSPRIIIFADGWTIATKDGSKASHYEHTIMITENGCEILTL